MEAFFEFEKPIAALEKRLKELQEMPPTTGVDISPEIKILETKLNEMIDEVYKGLSPWQRVQLSRHPSRPYALDYIPMIFTDFTELHGDRLFGDDTALVCGLAKLDGKSVAIIAQQKGRNTKQKIERNFGMARPEGYRKALRIMKMAAQFGIPIVTFIDTPGAFPGVGAEERGQSEAIARNIMEMFQISSPIVSCVIGEGGSGGALAIGVADRILMLEYSTYSVISPESCASILWSDSNMSETAAKIMKMTAEDIAKLKAVDEVVAEPKGGAHRDWDSAAKLLKEALVRNITMLVKEPSPNLQKKRLQKFRVLGSRTIVEKKAKERD